MRVKLARFNKIALSTVHEIQAMFQASPSLKYKALKPELASVVVTKLLIQLKTETDQGERHQLRSLSPFCELLFYISWKFIHNRQTILVIT